MYKNSELKIKKDTRHYNRVSFIYYSLSFLIYVLFPFSFMQQCPPLGPSYMVLPLLSFPIGLPHHLSSFPLQVKLFSFFSFFISLSLSLSSIFLCFVFSSDFFSFLSLSLYFCLSFAFGFSFSSESFFLLCLSFISFVVFFSDFSSFLTYFSCFCFFSFFSLTSVFLADVSFFAIDSV